MKILSLDSSGQVASVAILEDGIIRAEYTTDYKKTHSQTLMPMLDEICKMTELDLKTIDAIAVAAGPGSFTGLRIGAATAKGLGLALNLPIIEVPTLEGLAFNLWGSSAVICPIMDARRNQVYTGLYTFNKKGQDYEMQACMDQCAMDIAELVEKINEIGKEVIFLGDGVDVYKEKIAELIKVPYSFAPAGNNRQKASSVAALGAKYYSEGKVVTAAEHEPVYLRKSQAERERESADKN